jgi:hypothetical protein
MRGVALVLAGAISMLSLMDRQVGSSIEVPKGAHPVLTARGEGVQIYTCSQGPGGYHWVLTAPDAKLLDDTGRQIGKHFAGPTWKLADGSQVVGELLGSKASEDAHAVAWLLLRAKNGSATGTLSHVTFIRRTGTRGGIADPSGCSSAATAGSKTRVPYSATYSFYAGNQPH